MSIVTFLNKKKITKPAVKQQRYPVGHVTFALQVVAVESISVLSDFLNASVALSSKLIGSH